MLGWGFMNIRSVRDEANMTYFKEQGIINREHKIILTTNTQITFTVSISPISKAFLDGIKQPPRFGRNGQVICCSRSFDQYPRTHNQLP